MEVNEKLKDDIFYVCSLVEFVARKTSNTRKYVVEKIGVQGITRHLEFADLNHCLSFEQVPDEVIEGYGIESGTENQNSKYKVPSFLSIGRVYQMLVCNVCEDDDVAKTIVNVFSSFVSDAMSDAEFNEKMATGLVQAKAGDSLPYEAAFDSLLKVLI